MPNITRRAALAAIPALSATAASGRAFPLSDSNYISDELARLLDAHADKLAANDTAGAAWDRIADASGIKTLGDHPAKHQQHQAYQQRYIDLGGPEAEAELEQTYRPLWEAENAIYAFRPQSMADVCRKAAFAMMCEEGEMPEQWVDLFIRSLLPEAA